MKFSYSVFVIFIVMVSFPICNTYGDTGANKMKQTQPVEKIVKANPVGTCLAEFKKYLNKNGIQHFKESRVELGSNVPKNWEDSIEFVISFAVLGERREIDGQPMQALYLIYANFDSSHCIAGYSFQKTFKE